MLGNLYFDDMFWKEECIKWFIYKVFEDSANY